MGKTVNTSNREWIRKVIAHSGVEKVPYNFAFSPYISNLLDQYYGGSAEKVLDFPIRMTSPVSIKPLYADPTVFGELAKDEFGVTWTTSSIDRGSPIYPCLPEDNLDGYKFPDAAESYRFEKLGQWCKDNMENFSIIWVGDLWERATFMRGMENLLIDLSLNPVFVHKLLRYLTDYILQTMGILFDSFSFDAIALSDDYGTQRAMIMSPDDWRKFIKPCLKEVYEYAGKNSCTVFHHSCGNIYPIIGDMIDIGLDILHPIQPEAMDILKLKREFGNSVTFCGGINTQYLLPYGTKTEIRDEVKQLKEHMGFGGGYILEPGITVQADVPVENILAMLEEAIS